MTSLIKNPHSQRRNFFSLQSTRHAQCFEHLNSSLPISAPELRSCKATCDLTVSVRNAWNRPDVNVLNVPLEIGKSTHRGTCSLFWGLLFLCDDAFCLCFQLLSNWLTSCNVGHWFIIAGYQITNMKMWKSMYGGNSTILPNKIGLNYPFFIYSCYVLYCSIIFIQNILSRKAHVNKLHILYILIITSLLWASKVRYGTVWRFGAQNQQGIIFFNLK